LSDQLTMLPDYAEFAGRLLEFSDVHGPAGIQGLISGLQCDPTQPRHGWYALALGLETIEQIPASLFDELDRLYEFNKTQLRRLDFDFHLWLPADEDALPARTDAVADWCRGFIMGLMTGNGKMAHQWSGEAGEFIRDVVRISEVEADTRESLESQEKAYAEIVEYLRVGAQLVYETLHQHVGQAQNPYNK
jgi:uncharacterized protein